MSRTYFLALTVVLLVALAGGVASAQDPAGEFDPANAVVNPALLYVLKQQEANDPANTVVKVQEASLTGVSTSGSLNRVAEYRPLESTVRLRRLYYQQSFDSSQSQVSLQLDTESTDDRRLVARFSAPEYGSIEIRDTRVLHRLEHTLRGITSDTRPGDTYLTKWEDTQGTLDVKVPGVPQMGLTAKVDNQSRAGQIQHTFFQLHRFNCTDCHSFSASRGLNQTTRGYSVGLQGSPAERTLLSVKAGESYFDDNSTVLTFNFGGPFGNSPVLSNLHSRDSSQSYLVATGGEDWRVAAQFYNLDRRNQNTGNTLSGRWFSGQALYRPSDVVQVMGGYSSEDQARSLSTNLGYNRDRLFIEADFMPVPEAYASLRLGQNDTNYSMGAAAFPQNRDRYIELRGGFRPDPSVRLKARFRADDLDNPFFPTDPTSRTLWEASASWSPLPVTVGFDYRNARQSGPIFSTSEETSLGYITAVLDNGFGLDATYAVTDIDSNSSAAFFMNDELGQLRLLQTGYPYTATLRSFTGGLQIPFGDSGFRLRPYYRRTSSDSQALLLPNFPFIPNDSRVNVVEETTAVRLDFPSWDENQIGIGWEQQQWHDLNNAANDGTFNLWMLNYSTRY